jgi:hypothetical protein
VIYGGRVTDLSKIYDENRIGGGNKIFSCWIYGGNEFVYESWIENDGI